MALEVVHCQLLNAYETTACAVELGDAAFGAGGAMAHVPLVGDAQAFGHLG